MAISLYVHAQNWLGFDHNAGYYALLLSICPLKSIDF